MNEMPSRLPALLLGVLSISASAALTGKVIMPDGTAVPNITVVQKSSGLSAVTDAQGAYQFGVPTGIAGMAAANGISQVGQRLVLFLDAPTPVEITVRDVRGQILSRQSRSFDAGRWSLDPAEGIAGSGMVLVEIRAGGLHRVVSMLRATGAAASSGKAATGTVQGMLFRAVAATDTLTLKDGASVIGKVGIASSTGTAPDAKTKVTKDQRVKFETMLNRAVASWVRYLKGHDSFPYDTVPVKIVGWAVSSTAYLRAGNSAVVTPWDGWMVRRVWSELVNQGRWTLP